ncbi:18702_t:CDS:2, partial [Funneliformis geosporum]
NMTFCIFGNGIFDPLNDSGNVIYDPVNDDSENGIYNLENDHKNRIYDPDENEIYVGTGTGSDLHSVFYTDDDLLPFPTILRERSGESSIKKQLVGYASTVHSNGTTTGAVKAITIEIKKRRKTK